MSYNKFKKLEMLRTQFGINDIQTAWLPENLPTKVPTNFILEALREAEKEALGTKKAKSGSIISPILKELKRTNQNNFSTFSGFEFNVDVKSGLNGFCDFILSSETQRLEISAPIICLVEAKKGEIEEGLAQCGAEMYAAQIYNEQKGKPRKAIYGCVTNAFSWCFMKFEQKDLFTDPNYVPLTFTEPERVLAMWQWILDRSLENK